MTSVDHVADDDKSKCLLYMTYSSSQYQVKILLF